MTTEPRLAWIEARKKLLLEEKAHTRERDRIRAARQALPPVKLTKNYQFEDDGGRVSLSDLFDQQPQLIVYHFMYGPTWEAPCQGCTAWANALNGTTAQFPEAKAELVVIARAPLPMLQALKREKGWQFRFVSASNSDFNQDFHASTDNLAEESRDIGTETIWFDRGENHGISVFQKDDSGALFHTYSCYNRGVEPMNGAFGYYDILPLGRAW